MQPTTDRSDFATVDEPVPAVCTVRDVCRHLRMSRATFDRHLHELPLIELERIGRLRRFTGKSVERIKRGRFGSALQQVR